MSLGSNGQRDHGEAPLARAGVIQCPGLLVTIIDHRATEGKQDKYKARVMMPHSV
jgi:hypothetical protein